MKVQWFKVHSKAKSRLSLTHLKATVLYTIQPVLLRLHWLPVRQHVEFKLALLIHKSLLGQLPPYLADDCQLIADSGRRTLRSSDTAMFVVRRTNSTFGDRSFAVAGARIWNSVPSSLRSADLSTERFKRALKTFLFVWDSGVTVTFCLRRTGYKFSDIHTYIHISFQASFINFLTYKLTNLQKQKSALLICTTTVFRDPLNFTLRCRICCFAVEINQAVEFSFFSAESVQFRAIYFKTNVFYQAV